MLPAAYFRIDIAVTYVLLHDASGQAALLVAVADGVAIVRRRAVTERQVVVRVAIEVAADTW